MVATRQSLVFRAFARSQRVGMRGRFCALGYGSGGSVGRAAIVFVTLFVSMDVCVKSTVVGLSVGIACGGDAKVGAPPLIECQSSSCVTH